MSNPKLVKAFADHFSNGGAFATIIEARQKAQQLLGEKIPTGTALAKQVDESIEAAVIRAARDIIQTSETTHQAYDRLVDLHSRQPALNVRSSTSVAQQAYSTPIPIAYLASTLAGITPDSTVYEPTAGHGALLLNSHPANATVNELNPDRARELRTQGYSVTEHDASTYRPQQQHDVVIANPPFGRVRNEQGKPRKFELPGNRRGTTQIDQAIALRALEAMKDNGRAVLILGGKLGDDEVTRSDRYNTLESRGFFKALYQQYNVTQHISIWGELYRKQGAGFPIDVIVISGREPSGLTLPAAAVPPIYRSFTQLKELMPNDRLRERTNHLPRLQQLSPGLEATSRGRPGTIPRPSSSRTESDDRDNLREVNDSANRVDDSPLARTNRRESASHSQPTLPSLEKPVIFPGASRTVRMGKPRPETPMVVDSGMGKDIRQPQRNTNRQVSDGRGSRTPLSSDSFGRPTGAPAVAGGTRRGDNFGELVELPNLRDVDTVVAESERDSNSDSRRIEKMAAPDVNPRKADGRGQTAEGIYLDNTAAPALERSETHKRADLLPSASHLLPSQEQIPDTQPLQVSYLPRSQGNSAQTIIPANMAAAAQTALDRLEQEQGDIDEYVRQNLGYSTKEQLWQVLYAEQIDAVALAFSQLDKGNIFLNGDQTGNGKGRFGAANIIRAQRQGYIPVFVTHKADLYNAMINDLADIGYPGFTPFATNNNLNLKLDDGRKLKTGAPLDQEAEMLRLMKQGRLDQYGAIFTTYTQLQTVGNKEPFRRKFFRTIASRAVFILDESHQAGGSTNKEGQWQTNGPPDRADFVRELVDKSAGTVFMSATATKDPAVMDLYARRSDARQAVSSLAILEALLKSGGVPLQQMVATKFVASGQMLRRERSMADISFDAKVVPVDREVADGISAIMRSIDAFDRAKQEVRKDLDKQLKREAKLLSEDNAIGEAGVQSINFTSLMHNAIDQGLLCQKAEITVQEAITSLQQGEKPLIAVASTMDAFIKQCVEDRGLNPGDPIDITFSDVLHRYLERSRDVIIKDYEGKESKHRLTDEELGAEGIAAYEEALDLIDSTDLSSIPLSSIDYIRWRLSQEGYRVHEITGRHNIIEYTASGKTSYSRRSSRETSPQGKIKIVNKFNSGELDVVILNKSGSTGISLHASEKFADQRPRHMIVAQAERDINEVMQMLGRANRFGQVVPPRFTLLMSDLPAEKRLGALLAKKMASLNANTTASRESDLSVSNVVDFMNVYGEEVITEILEDDPELDAKLSFPSQMSSNNDSDIALISRVTGRIPLLPIEEQEQLYSIIESETLALIAQKEAMGENVLQADQLDLDARTMARMEVIPGQRKAEDERQEAEGGKKDEEFRESEVQEVTQTSPNPKTTEIEEGSPNETSFTVQPESGISHSRLPTPDSRLPSQESEFNGPVYLEMVDAKVLSKPLTQLQVVNQVRENLSLSTAESVAEHDFEAVANLATAQAQETAVQLRQATEKYRHQALLTKRNDQARDRLNDRLDRQLSHVMGVLEQYSPGTSVRVVSPEQGNITYGIVARVWQKNQNGSPSAPTNWRVQILTDNQARQITIPLSKFNSGKDNSLEITPQQVNWHGESVYEAFDLRQQQQNRTERQIFTGNILKAYEKYPRGKLVNYTDNQGGIRQGLVMPAGFDIQESLRSEPVPFAEPYQVRAFITDITQNQGSVKTLDENLTIKTQAAARLERGEARGFVLQTPKSSQAGGKYFLDEEIIAAAGSDFYSVSDRMEVVVPADQIEAVLNLVMKEKGYTLAAFDFQDQARDYLGVNLPSLETVDVGSRESGFGVSAQPNGVGSGGLELEANSNLQLLQEQPETTEETKGTSPELPSIVNSGQRKAEDERQSAEGGKREEEFRDSEVQEVTQTSPNSETTEIEEGSPNETSFTAKHESGISHSRLPTPDSRLPSQKQRGGAEKNIAKFLNQAGLFELVMANPDFHLRIENKPYIPLVVERHDNQLYLTHYLTENGDTYIDSEMVFNLSESGRLSLRETAVSSIGGEYRVLDRHFAQVFSRNIIEQGFAEAAQQLVSTQVKTQEVNSSSVQEVTQTSPNPETTEIEEDSPNETSFITKPESGISHSRLPTPDSRLPTAFPVETPTLFDVKQFAAHTGVQADYQMDVAGDELPLPRRVSEPPTSPSTTPESTSAVSQPSPSHFSLGEVADQVRDADLETVAADLGLVQDRHDKHKWKDGEHTISINGSKFMDWRTDRGGGGAIDLVMHVRKVDFPRALEWLSGQSLSPHISFSKQQSQIEPAEPRPLEMPTPHQEKWTAVRQYLVESRGLPAVLVDHIHERGLVYADDKQNAVFVRYASNGDGAEWERKEPTGASLRGTWGENNSFFGLAPGSSREQGWFWIGAGKGEVKRVFLTESPIDALSLATIDKNRQTAAGISIYLSTDGSGAVPTEALQRVLEGGGQVVAAFDVDQAGEEMAWRLAQELPGVSRVSPAYGKDWNERLLMEGKPELARQFNRDKETMRSLWDWHRAAREMGKSENYLNRITEVAREFNKGEPLSGRARAAMQHDLQEVQRQRQREKQRQSGGMEMGE